MVNGEVKESLLVSQASSLVANTIMEIEKLRAENSASVVYPHGIGNISVQLTSGQDSVVLNVGSAQILASVPHQLKLTMVYTITGEGVGPNSSIATHITDAKGNVIPLTADGKQHSAPIAM